MAEAATKIDKARDVQITSGRVRLATEATNRWGVTLTPDMNYDDLLIPRFWAHVAVKFTPGDIIEVRTDDGTHYGEFYVLSCSRIHVNLKKLRWVSLGDEDGASYQDPDELVYKWNGPHDKHCVARVSDGGIVMRGLATKADALKWIAAQ
jgi:hypothetical protein